MKKTILGGIAAAAALGIAASPAGPASADTFLICPDGHSGIATTVTTCDFANNVRVAWYTQPGSEVIAYSPVTGEVYPMQCGDEFTATVYGRNVNAVRCTGGNNAVVWVW